MKKYGKLLTKISLIVLAVSLFLSLSLSDVIRLNPQLEGVSKAQLVSTAKKATVDEKVSVLIPADELPEAPAATEATMEWSPEGYPELDINGDGEPDGFLLSYEDFAALGGQFLKDKYGAVRQVELEGVHYAQGRVNNKGLLWQQLRFSSRALCALAVVYVPLIVLGAALLAGLAVGVYDNLAETAHGWHVESKFVPSMDPAQRQQLLHGWKRAVDAVLYWARED